MQSVTDNVTSITSNINWAVRIVVGAVIAALVSLVLLNGGRAPL